MKLILSLAVLVLAMQLTACSNDHKVVPVGAGASPGPGQNKPGADKGGSSVCDTTGVDGSKYTSIVNGEKLGAGNVFSSRIVNLYFKSSEGTAICTGALLPGNVVLTAGHCVPPSTSDISDIVVLFTNNINCVTSLSDSSVRAVTAISKNPNYHDTTADSDDDLAMIHFKGDMPAGYTTFDLPTGITDVTQIKSIIMSGFGITSNNGQQGAGVLRITSLPSTRVTKRQDRPGSWTVDQHDTGVCSGDSGSPLMSYVGGKLQIIGVTSTVFKSNDSAPGTDICSVGSTFVDIGTYSHQQWIMNTYASLHD